MGVASPLSMGYRTWALLLVALHAADAALTLYCMHRFPNYRLHPLSSTLLTGMFSGKLDRQELACKGSRGVPLSPRPIYGRGPSAGLRPLP